MSECVCVQQRFSYSSYWILQSLKAEALKGLALVQSINSKWQRQTINTQLDSECNIKPPTHTQNIDGSGLALCSAYALESRRARWTHRCFLINASTRPDSEIRGNRTNYLFPSSSVDPCYLPFLLHVSHQYQSTQHVFLRLKEPAEAMLEDSCV